MNIEIVRAFVRLRSLLAAHTELAKKLSEMEKKYDEQFKVVFDAIRASMTPPKTSRRKIGFEVKEGRTTYSRQEKKQEMMQE